MSVELQQLTSAPLLDEDARSCSTSSLKLMKNTQVDSEADVSWTRFQISLCQFLS